MFASPVPQLFFFNAPANSEIYTLSLHDALPILGNFYPTGTKPAEFLREYARRLTTIEGNTTFYAIPAPKTIESWIEHTPETFRFCPKIPKAIRSEEHTSELQSHVNLVCRLLLEK